MFLFCRFQPCGGRGYICCFTYLLPHKEPPQAALLLSLTGLWAGWAPQGSASSDLTSSLSCCQQIMAGLASSAGSSWTKTLSQNRLGWVVALVSGRHLERRPWAWLLGPLNPRPTRVDQGEEGQQQISQSCSQKCGTSFLILKFCLLSPFQ